MPKPLVHPLLRRNATTAATADFAAIEPPAPTPGVKAAPVQHRRRESRTLLLASTGGHLGELYRLRQRLDIVEDRPLWVTFDTEQSRALLAGEEVLYVPLTAPRDWRNVIKNTGAAWRIIRDHNIDRVISTGSGIALSFFPIARFRRASCHFIETAARRHGPSMTGRLLSFVPGVRCYTQCDAWENQRWKYRGSLFDGFDSSPPKPPAEDRPIKVVVTLGTMPHSFESALVPLAGLLSDPARFDVRWQVGNTPSDGLGIDGFESVRPQQLQEWMNDADLVIAHAGMGSTLDALEAGRRPVLIARSATRGEHVDDHQIEIARELARRGLAEALEPADISIDRLEAAIGGRVTQTPAAATAPFVLDGDPRRPASPRPG